MPVRAMGEPVVDHQRQFQAAVDVIQNLPKNGSYRPSYEVMLRFYSLYKQAVCGRCTAARPGFWDPVGRYKWDAWSCLGEMSSDSAMEAYVDEMKKVAQEVIDSMPMNEKTASLFHHFEPLYLVIDDMPRPPESLFALSKVLKEGNHPPSEEADPDEGQEPNQSEGVAESTAPHEPRLSEGLALTSDSETEVFCDSVDSVEQLRSIKASKEIPLIKCNGFHNSRVPSESRQQLDVRQVGAGHGGEGAEDVKDQGPSKRGRESGRDASHHSWREGGVPQGSSRRGTGGGSGGGGTGAGRGGGDGSEGGAEQLHDAHLQQQIVLALRRLREDMRSVMDRLEAVERLAATHAQGSEWRQCLQCVATASQQEEQRWWSLDVSPPTLLLFLLWPFAAQGLMFLLRRAHRRTRTPS